MSFKKKVAKFFRTKGGKATVFGTLGFIVFAIACLVLGYGLSEGWDVVIAFFSSKWIWYIYVGLGLYIFIILYILFIANLYE